MIPALPDVALGAIIAALIAGMVSLAAALIAGLISLLGLIVSKEQKTSEFRQAWIDALRQDLSSYLTGINAAQDASRLTYTTDAAKLKAMQPHYLELNKATFNILLRLNPKEKLSRDVLSCLGEFNTLARDSNTLTVENIRPVQAKMLVTAQELLKSEWRRVKAGELTFQTAKWLALFVVLTVLSVGGWLVTQASKALPHLPGAAMSSTGSKAIGKGAGAEPERNVKVSPDKSIGSQTPPAEASTSSHPGPRDDKPNEKPTSGAGAQEAPTAANVKSGSGQAPPAGKHP